MFYLCLAFSVVWLVNFIYLFMLDRQTKNIRQKLEAGAGN
jgi:CcmD family protein